MVIRHGVVWRGINQHGRSRRGFVFAEALIGLALLGIILSAVIVAVHAQRRIAARLSDDRDSARRVQQTLFALQAHRPGSRDVVIHVLPTTAPAGWQWATATSGRVSIAGVIPTLSNRGEP